MSLENGDNIVIFPEDSSKGYLAELEGFFAGFATLADRCLKSGMDVPIYVSYYRRADNTYIFDKPVLYSALKSRYKTKEEIADALRIRCNELSRIDSKENEQNQKEKIAV